MSMIRWLMHVLGNRKYVYMSQYRSIHFVWRSRSRSRVYILATHPKGKWTTNAKPSFGNGSWRSRCGSRFNTNHTWDYHSRGHGHGHGLSISAMYHKGKWTTYPNPLSPSIPAQTQQRALVSEAWTPSNALKTSFHPATPQTLFDFRLSVTSYGVQKTWWRGRGQRERKVQTAIPANLFSGGISCRVWDLWPNSVRGRLLFWWPPSLLTSVNKRTPGRMVELCDRGFGSCW
jgi:hypothetical protein